MFEIPTGSSARATANFTTRIWMICFLLLSASAINYMDRQTLASVSVRISKELHLTELQYGTLEARFGYAFAVGSVVFGFIADRFSVRWLYAIVLVLWSAVGFATSFVRDYDDLLLCRLLLGFFEAGHWPCGIKATRALLASEGRAFGNSLLQSGTSIGAVSTPLIMRMLLTPEEGSWRFPFQIVGAVGLVWLVLWLMIVRAQDLHDEDAIPAHSSGPPWWRAIFTKQLFLIFISVALINTTWQFLRAWLPKILQQGRGYTEAESLNYNALWFICTDIGCIGAGLLTVWLVRRNFSVLAARKIAFLVFASLCALAVTVPWLPKGWLLLGVLLIAGAGALGIFPLYYTFSQGISAQHQGKVTGLAGISGWVVSSRAQTDFGAWVDSTKSFDTGLAVFCCLPLVAGIILFIFWDRDLKSPGQVL